jgi:hypothetical protein
MIWWVIKKLFGLEPPSHYLRSLVPQEGSPYWGCLDNNELDEELDRLKKHEKKREAA